MRLVGDGVAAGVRLVFLDTADWSYAETERDPDAVATLRALGNAGVVKFVVTHDHIVEIAGLRGGMRHRLGFLRDFPGTILFPFSGSRVLRLAAAELAVKALGGEHRGHPIQVFPMREQSLDDLVAITRQTWPLQLAHRFRAYVSSRTSNSGAPKPPREERDAFEKLQRLARSGDREKFDAHLAAKAPQFGGIKGVLQRTAGPLLLPLYQWTSSRGLTAPFKQADLLFDQLVTSVLPAEFSTNKVLLEGLVKLWAKPEALALMSPSLACVKAIAKAQTPTRKIQTIESTEHDKNHAAFAPHVAVFTCDKRNQPHVAKAVELARCDTRVLRTGSLADVVQALASA